MKTIEKTGVKCRHTGHLLIPSAKDDIYEPMINERFEVIAACKMRKNAWYILHHPGEMLTPETSKITIKKRQYINLLRRDPANHVKEFYNNRPYATG